MSSESKIYRPIVLMRRDMANKWVELHDTTTAKQFGELLNPIIHFQFIEDYREEWIVEKLTEGLASFTNDDFLLLSGDPELLAMAIIIASVKIDGKIKLLKWDKRNLTYAVRYYEFNEQRKDLKKDGKQE